MSAPQTACVAAADTGHPHWCDSARCSSLPNGPDIAPTLLHDGVMQSWRVDDCKLELRLVQADDPLDPVRGPVGQPRVELLVTSECRGFRDGDVILTVAEATDLVHRVQALLDVAARDGR